MSLSPLKREKMAKRIIRNEIKHILVGNYYAFYVKLSEKQPAG